MAGMCRTTFKYYHSIFWSKVKVTLTLEQVMKAQRVSRGTALLFL
jgi:hypothetical protein